MKTSITNFMSFKHNKKNFLVVFISLVYLVFSCCYVAKCQKISSLLLTKNTQSILQKTKPQKKAAKHGAGNFMTRPRVISHGNKINSTLVAILVLSCLFIGFNNRQEYRLPFFVYFKRLYSIDLIVTFGNLKI
jgi:hypothetical protein